MLKWDKVHVFYLKLFQGGKCTALYFFSLVLIGPLSSLKKSAHIKLEKAINDEVQQKHMGN